MKLSQFAKKNSITYTTAYKMYKSGKLKSHQLPTGTIVVEEEVENIKLEHNVIYTRVSSSENKSNLDSQAERIASFCLAKGWKISEVVKECASGLNDNRPKLCKILSEGKATRIIVEHKDRLTRFGFNYLKILCKHIKCDLIVINEAEEKKEDLIQDFISIITSFCVRIYGYRRSKRNTEKLIKELEENKE